MFALQIGGNSGGTLGGTLGGGSYCRNNKHK